MNNGKIKYLYQALYIIAGLFLAALGYRLFLIPNSIAPGGFTGIGQLFNAMFGWQVGTVVLCLNIPLFFLGLKSIGWKFTALSLGATLAFSLILDYLPVAYASNDIVLSTLFGGIMSGAGFGLILRGGASTGGTDMLAKIIHEHFHFIKVGVVMFAVDFIVVFGSMFVFDVASAMYALVSLFISSYVLDFVIDGLNTAKAYFVISKRSDQISQRIMSEMDRGVTALKGKGKYTGDDTEVLLCVVYRMEVLQLKRIISECDDKAFVIATDVREALGEGFAPHR